MPIYTPGPATYNNPIRYIRDSVNGSNKNTSSHWVEIQALDSSGNNIAKGKTATLVSGTTEGQTISRLTDGDTATANYVGASGTSPIVQVDLGAIYDIANIKVWHYYGDGRTYNNPVTQVSSDGSTWVTISDGTTYAETSAGKTWSCDKVASQQVLVNYEIGKVHDYDGTTYNQIGKIHDYDGVEYHLIYSSEMTMTTQLSGSVAASGSPSSTGAHWRSVTTSNYWDFSGASTILSIAGTFTGGISYWQGSGSVYDSRTIYLKFSDGTTKQIWGASSATSWSASNIDISGYTDAQKSKVYINAANNCSCSNVSGSYFTALNVATTQCTIS